MGEANNAQRTDTRKGAEASCARADSRIISDVLEPEGGHQRGMWKDGRSTTRLLVSFFYSTLEVWHAVSYFLATVAGLGFSRPNSGYILSRMGPT